MKHISILVYEEVVLTALSSIASLLESANDAVVRRGKPAPFQIELVSVHYKNRQTKIAGSICLYQDHSREICD